jgi:hypothetical protein
MLCAWNTDGHDMIFRALFWIGLVSLLMPHEPDLGLGHPAAGRWADPLSVFHLNLNRGLVAGLADVKAQIQQDRLARAGRVKTI